jgi:hypothetical protein
MAQQHKILSWAARITGSIVLVFFLIFFIGEGIPDIINGKGKELIQFIPFVLPVFIGFFIAWFRPVAGGWILLAGAALLAGYFIYLNNIRAAMIFALPPALIGACFLASVDRELI